MTAPKPKLEIIYRAVDDLIPYINNARTHSAEQVAQIAASIREFGWTNPVLVDGKNGIIAGHGRVLAARRLGLKEVPTLELSHMTASQKRAYILADNRLAESAGWSADLLRIELGDLVADGFDVGLTGFSQDEINALLTAGTAGLTDPDEVPAAPKEAVTRPGDVWLLGAHRLACIDACDIGSVERLLMAGAKADMVFTDPPYNVDYDGKKNSVHKAGGKQAARSKDKILNDKMSPEEFLQFCRDFFATYLAVSKSGAAFYVCHASRSELEFLRAFRESGLHYAAAIIWVKDSLVLSRGDYHFQHEPIIYGAKEGGDVQFHGNPTDAHYEAGHEMMTYSWPKTGRHQFFGGRKQTTVWEIPRPRSSTMHPTQKPVELVGRALSNSSKGGDVIVDLFGGSGSTLLACEKLGRVARISELDPIFCDVIVQRWQNYSGKAATLEKGGQSYAQMLVERGVKNAVPGADKNTDRKGE
ncbi:MAG TPA: site-specific DNA-methyltransferase [Burkholderiales bacterium]